MTIIDSIKTRINPITPATAALIILISLQVMNCYYVGLPSINLAS
jgi:hypothetical protein